LLPTVVAAAGFNALIGPRGWINQAAMGLLNLQNPPVEFVGTLGAILAAHVFYNTTIVIRIVGSALSNLAPRLSEAARVLGADGRRAFRHVTLPLLRPSVLAAGLLVFLFDFTSFGVILLLGGAQFATLEVEIYIQAVSMLNLPLAALLSAIQLACTLAFSALYTRLTRRQTAANPRPQPAIRAKTIPQRLFLFTFSFFLFTFFVLPLLALPLRSLTSSTGFTGDFYRELFINRRGSVFYVPPADALRNSLIYAGTTVLISLSLGFPATRALSRQTWLTHLLDPLLLLPLGASAVMLGLGFILTFNRLLAQPWLVPLAHTTIALPFVIRTLQPALASIPERLRQAAASLGASPLKVWLTVDWPIIWRAALAAATFAFTVSIGEFGATALLTRPEYPTIPVAIYRFLSQPGGLNYGQAMAMATLLMAVTTLAILFIERLRLPGGEF
jgi:thiamine transport system permease protein